MRIIVWNTTVCVPGNPIDNPALRDSHNALACNGRVYGSEVIAW